MDRARNLCDTVKLQTPDDVRSVKIVQDPELSWSGNLLVRNFAGQNLLVRKLFVPNACWSESY
jgi:hypothetical protein